MPDAQGRRIGQRLPDRIENELAFNDFEVVLSVRGTLRAPRTLDVPVNTDLTRLTVLSDPSPALNATLVRPDGSAENADVRRAKHGRLGKARFSATTTGGSIRSVSPQAGAIDSGGSLVGTVAVAVPADADAGDMVEVTVVATNAADAAVYNSDRLSIDVAGRDDRDGDVVPDASDNCPDFPNSTQLDLNGNGKDDACEDTQAWPTTRFDTPPQAAYPGPDFAVGVATDSDGPIQLDAVRGPCTRVNGRTFRPTGVGLCVVRAITAPTAKHQWSLATLIVPIVPGPK